MKAMLWVDRLSLLSLVKILMVVNKENPICIFYVRISFLSFSIVRLITLLNILEVEIHPIRASLGDLYDENQSLGMKMQYDLPAMACEILGRLKERSLFGHLSRHVPLEKANVYYEQRIKEEIRLLMYLKALIEYQIGQDNSKNDYLLIYKYSPLVREIQAIWKGREFALITYANIGYIVYFIKKAARIFLKNIVFHRGIRYSKNINAESHHSIAVHYRQGFDVRRRSDIFWLYPSKINPQRVVVIVNDGYYSKDISMKDALFKKIEDMDMRWVTWSNGIACKKRRLNEKTDYSKTPSIPLKASNLLDLWILLVAKELLQDVHLWAKLYSSLNIKIAFDIGVQTNEAIAQSLALDMIGGIRFGVQRSTVSMLSWLPYLRENANHIFFSWGGEVEKHINTSRIIKYFVQSGYPFDYYLHNRGSNGNLLKELDIKTNKNTFIIALFDNAYTNDIHFSENMMCTFYSKFLEWMIEDEDVIILTKEKKPEYVDKIESLKGLLQQASKTGRFVRLGNAKGRFPFDASSAADLSVGIGISTAVSESVLAGLKGIHCDLPGLRLHYFYEWGNERIIFNDIDNMMSAIKCYKNDKSSNPMLGEWSEHVSKMDPFRDGRASERIGAYLQWCLDGYDAGGDRDTVIAQANSRYASMWGLDKIVQVNN